MNKQSFLEKAREQSTVAIILFELVLSIIFVLTGHFMGNAYIRGVGVGLIIAWVTSTIAYFRIKSFKQ